MIKSQSNILLESGDETAQSTPPNRKRSFNDVIKTALLCGTCFMLVVLRGPSAIASPLAELIPDLNSLDTLKNEVVGDELELHWDRQHIRELQHNINSMRSSFDKLTQTFHEEESDLETKNTSLREALITTSDLNTSVQKFDKELLLQLTRQAEKVRMEYNKEVEENASLKKLLADTIHEMQENGVPVPQVALRGSPLNV